MTWLLHFGSEDGHMCVTLCEQLGLDYIVHNTSHLTPKSEFYRNGERIGEVADFLIYIAQKVRAVVRGYHEPEIECSSSEDLKSEQ